MSSFNLSKIIFQKLQLVFTVLFLLFITGNAYSNEENLVQMKERANSDDAQSVEEVFFHSNARALVIMHVEPNKLNVGGREFQVRNNPFGSGCFVYDPRTNFSGVERFLIWYVSTENEAYPLNGPSKMVTPSLPWARDVGVGSPITSDVIKFLFNRK